MSRKYPGMIELAQDAAWCEFWRQLCELRPECVRELEILAPEFIRCCNDGPNLTLPVAAFQEIAAEWAARWNLRHDELLLRAVYHLDGFCTDHAGELPDCKRYRDGIKLSMFQLEIRAYMQRTASLPLDQRTAADWERRIGMAREAGVPVFEFCDVWDRAWGEGKNEARKRIHDRFEAALKGYFAAVEREDAADPEPYWTGKREQVGWLVRRIVPREAGGRGETDREIRRGRDHTRCSKTTNPLARFLGASELLPAVKARRTEGRPRA